MANLIVLAGFSNSGKSTSLKYLDPTETFIVSCTNKQLQIPGFRKKYKPIALVFAESSMSNLQSVSIVAAFPIGAVIVLISASFLKDAKKHLAKLNQDAKSGQLQENGM